MNSVAEFVTKLFREQQLCEFTTKQFREQLVNSAAEFVTKSVVQGTAGEQCSQVRD